MASSGGFIRSDGEVLNQSEGSHLDESVLINVITELAVESESNISVRSDNVTTQYSLVCFYDKSVVLEIGSDLGSSLGQVRTFFFKRIR